MHQILKAVCAAVAVGASAQVVAQVIFYENEGYTGRSFTTERKVNNLEQYGFNDRASSAVVLRELWEVCEDARHTGRCAVLRPGRYPSLSAMGLNNRVSSVRTVPRTNAVNTDRHASPTEPVYDNYRRSNERLYEANVTSVRAVVGPAERRCWIEPAQAIQERSDKSIPAAVASALLGNVLSHQVAGGPGDGSAVGYGAGGSTGKEPATRRIDKCTAGPNRAVPRYWDVGYTFRGVEHRMQTATPPGATVTVNRLGEPRA